MYVSLSINRGMASSLKKQKKLCICKLKEMKAKGFTHVFHDDGSVQQTSRTWVVVVLLAQHRRSTTCLLPKSALKFG
jgi:hypothetical protein